MRFESTKKQKNVYIHNSATAYRRTPRKASGQAFWFLFDHDCGELFFIFRSCLLWFVLTCTFASQLVSRCGVALVAVISHQAILCMFRGDFFMNQLYQNQVPEDWRLKKNSMMLGPRGISFFPPGMCPKNPPCNWLRRSTIHQYLPSFQCQWPPTSARNCILAGDGCPKSWYCL